MDCERPPQAEPLPKLMEDELAGNSMSIASAGFVNLEAAGPASMTSSSTSDGSRRAPVPFQQTASRGGPPLLDNSAPLIDSTRTSTAPLTSRMAAMRNMSGHPRRQMEDVELVQLADQVSTLATHKLLPMEPASGGDWERQHTAPLLAENEKITGKEAGLRSLNVPAEEPALDALRERRPVRSLSLPLRPRLHVRFQDTGTECYTFGAAGEVIPHFSPHAQPRHSCLMASPGEQGGSQRDGPDGVEEEELEEAEEAEGDDEAEEGPRAKLRRLASLNGGSGSWQLKRAQLLGSLTGSPRGKPADTLK